MRILVTGSAGKIGREQVKLLREQGHEVRTFDVKTRPDDDGEHIFGDLRDVMKVREAARRMDAIVHLGAVPNDRAGREDEVLDVNVRGTFHVLLAAAEAGVGRIVYFSSVNALGAVGGHRPALHLPIDDDHPRHPMTPYQLSKHLAEEACRSFSERYGMVTIALRPVLVMHVEQYEWFKRRRDRNQEWAKAEFWAYVDGRDVCDATVKALAVEGVKHDAFLLTADDTTSTVPTAELVDTYYPDTPWQGVEREEYLRDNPYRSLMDCSHAKRVLGWQPQYSWRSIVEQE